MSRVVEHFANQNLYGPEYHDIQLPYPEEVYVLSVYNEVTERSETLLVYTDFMDAENARIQAVRNNLLAETDELFYYVEPVRLIT